MREDHERLEQMQEEYQPDLLIGSTPCTSIRALLHPHKTKEQTERMQDEERQHTQACIKAYKRPWSMGRHFLHEQPKRAPSWPVRKELLSDGGVHLVQDPISRWCMTARDDGGEQRTRTRRKENGLRVARDWQHCWRESVLERIVACG